MIANFVIALGPWRWFVIGLLLLTVELIAPGTVLLWLGVAAIVVGIAAFVFDPGWQIELIAFAVLGLLAAIGWWKLGHPHNAAVSDQPMLNRRAERHVGKTFYLEAPIENGHGRIKIDDTSWRVAGPDMPSGTRVKVVAAEGTTLKVAAEL